MSKNIKLNCWEFMNCGYDECLAKTTQSSSGINDGTNGGRICWSVAGTECRKEMIENHSLVYDDCLQCKFFLLVKQQECGGKFTLLLEEIEEE
ncbi:MAG: hypothetical protein HQK91_14445 [Nitrospirae bacterium]|nr:hypothetical protein [Nitrospirota bacterium]